MSKLTLPQQRLAKVALVIVALQLIYTVAFVLPGHDPKANGLKVAVAGNPTQVEQARSQLQPFLPGVELKRTSSAQQAQAAVSNRDAYGAMIFARGGEKVLIASGASFTVASVLERAAQQAKLPPPTELKPLASGDPRGSTLNLLMVPLVVTSLIGAQLAIGLLGATRARRRIGMVAVASSLSALLVMLFVGPVLNALPGPFLPETGLVALASFGLLSIGAGLIRLLGPAGLGLGFAAFLMIGSPASGAASAPELLPIPWAQIGGFLPPGALANGLRSVAYFDEAKLVKPLVVLAVLAAIGIVLEHLADRRRKPVDPAKRPEVSTSPVERPEALAPELALSAVGH